VTGHALAIYAAGGGHPTVYFDASRLSANRHVPVAWSGNGARLLASYQGQDTSQTWTLVPTSGALHRLTVGGQDLDAAGISSSGATVLVDQGAFMDVPSGGTVETLPFAGGRPTVLVPHGADPSWNR
jgi:hypothetical protein